MVFNHGHHRELIQDSTGVSANRSRPIPSSFPRTEPADVLTIIQRERRSIASASSRRKVCCSAASTRVWRRDCPYSPWSARKRLTSSTSSADVVAETRSGDLEFGFLKQLGWVRH